MRSQDRKGEGVGGVIKIDFTSLGRRSGWTRDDRLGNLIPIHCWVSDL